MAQVLRIIILSSMGFNNAMSQIVIAVSYVWPAIPALAMGFVADHYRNGSAFMVAFNVTMMVVRTAMYSQLPAAQRGCVIRGRKFISIGGCTSNTPRVISWCQTSIRAQSKRAFASALVIGWDDMEGIIATVSFMEKEAKRNFPTGVYLTLGLNVDIVAIALGLNGWYACQNRRAD